MRARAFLLACLLALSAARTWAEPLAIEIKDIRSPTSSVIATLELRDLIPDRFRSMIQEGSTLHLRVQTELWESRPVWDRLVYPAIVRVFRIVKTPASARDISISDDVNTARRPIADPLSVVIDLGNSARVVNTGRYYVHVVATLGTLAQSDADQISDAVFGRPSETNGLGGLGRLVLRTAIQISDYVQSVTAETKSRRLNGGDVLKP